jgi:hypothetical protein
VDNDVLQAKSLSMKPFGLILTLAVSAFLMPTLNGEAQVTRNRTVVVAKNANKRQIRRQTRRQFRRIHRRNRFRTLRVLPQGTRAIAFRNTNYYPVGGVYYVRRNGVYVRRVPPRGFRLARLTGRLIRLSVRNNPYIFSEGIFYREVDGYYEVADAPKGAVLDELPADVEEMVLDDMTVYELYDILYAETEQGYEVMGTLDDFED